LNDTILKDESKQNKKSRGQFHQHFMRAFFAFYFWAKKLQSPNITREKLRKALLYKKFVQKICTKNVDEIDYLLTYFPKTL
jgi:hypothetical protein